jgi:hypothetical protein
MSTPKLTQIRIRAGIWEGELTGAGPELPTVEVEHLNRPLKGVQVEPIPSRDGHFAVKVPIPAELLSEGVQTFLILLKGEVLTHFTVITGVAMEDDLRAEFDLMRAELDMLKRAFRQHCVATAG